uniref:Phosphomevalonate kinase n=1 Tax=Anopheles atroparvus TaxID=41427 RepID=A0A182JMP7_ANOAO
MSTMEATKPKLVILLSGKRKSGKDYFAEALHNKLGSDRAQVIRIAEPIKRHWADGMGLDLTELLSNSEYKEGYRRQMIVWSDARRREDYGVFCRAACTTIQRDICIVSDVRRKTDIRYFLEMFGSERVRTVRIEADEATRASRGWQFESGVDDVQSECDLDDFNQWDLVLSNDGVKKVGELLELLLATIGI